MAKNLTQSWSAGQMGGKADLMDWNALYQMAQEVRERLELLRSQPTAE